MEKFIDVIRHISYPGLGLIIGVDGDRHYLQVRCENGTCNHTGETAPWSGRKWMLSRHMTDGEIVQTAFAAILMALEHEARERFTYKGVSIFDPHYDIEKLVELRCDPNSIKGRV